MNGKSLFLAKIIAIVSVHLSNPALKGELIAQELGISRMHLHRQLKAYTGGNAHQFILNQRILFAKKALCETEQSIEEIAQATGFQSLSYFSKVFKKATNFTPSQYRKSCE